MSDFVKSLNVFLAELDLVVLLEVDDTVVPLSTKSPLPVDRKSVV